MKRAQVIVALDSTATTKPEDWSANAIRNSRRSRRMKITHRLIGGMECYITANVSERVQARRLHCELFIPLTTVRGSVTTSIVRFAHGAQVNLEAKRRAS